MSHPVEELVLSAKLPGAKGTQVKFLSRAYPLFLCDVYLLVEIEQLH